MPSASRWSVKVYVKTETTNMEFLPTKYELIKHVWPSMHLKSPNVQSCVNSRYSPLGLRVESSVGCGKKRGVHLVNPHRAASKEHSQAFVGASRDRVDQQISAFQLS